MEEDTQIVYNDGVRKLFLYVGGELGGNEDLKNLLHYFSKSDKENVVDPELMQLHGIVETARSNKEVGEQYMTWEDYVECEIEEAVEKAVEKAVAEATEKVEKAEKACAETREEGIHKLINSLRVFQISDEQILEQVMEKYQLSLEEAKAYLN